MVSMGHVDIHRGGTYVFYEGRYLLLFHYYGRFFSITLLLEFFPRIRALSECDKALFISGKM